MRSAPLGPATSAPEVTNVSTHCFWLLLGDEELAVPFSDFPMNGAGMTTVINAQGKVEFVFPPQGNAAFFRVQSQ